MTFTTYSPLLLIAMMNLLSAMLKESREADELKLSVVLISRDKQISDDSTGLINDYLYSHEITMSITSSIMEMLCNLSPQCPSDPNKSLYIGNVCLAAAFAMNQFGRNRSICYHGCQIVHNLTYLTNTVTDFNDSKLKLIFNRILIKVKKAYVSDPQISRLLCRIIKNNFKNSPLGKGWCYIHIIISLYFYIYQIYQLCFSPSFSGTHAIYAQSNHFIFHRDLTMNTMKQTAFSFMMSTIYYATCTFYTRRHHRSQVNLV